MQGTLSTDLVLDLLKLRMKNFKEIEEVASNKKEYTIAQDARSKYNELAYILESLLIFLLNNQPT